MNYRRHYDLLIERARHRVHNGYVENHHIIPRCLCGSNEKENLVNLTPEEHYVAHQLLIKLYPGNRRIVHAAIMMIPSGNAHQRNNKLYGWLRKQYSAICKERTGSKNGSYGKPWYHDPETLRFGKFLPGEEPADWQRGRVPKTCERICRVCDVAYVAEKEMRTRTCSDICQGKYRKKLAVAQGEKQKIPVSEDVILEIIRRHATGESLRSLAPEFNINKWTIYDIVARHNR